jgi:glycosyltransferase involved in cell wall biosynthesis
MAARLLYVVTEDWYFLSHRLPMARAAKAAGYEVHVATRFGKGREEIEKEGFATHPLSWQRGSISGWHSLRGVIELREVLNKVRPEIQHNIALKPVLLGSVAALGVPGIKLVNSLTGLGTLFIGNHGTSGTTRNLVRRALKALLGRKGTVTVVQNPDDRRFVLELGVPEGAVLTIPGSGVDIEHLKPMPEPPPPVVAAYAGRMLADKGVLTLIEAFSLATSRGTPLQLLLAGDTDKENPGSLAPEQLREFASAFGIRWLGHVADIRDVWEKAHFAVLASYREGLPKSLLEAAACGRPMVATDTTGCREIAIDGKTALTVPVNDAPALAEAMTKMASDPEMRARFGKAARELVEEKFSSEAIGKATVALYESLAPASGG